MAQSTRRLQVAAPLDTTVAAGWMAAPVERSALPVQAAYRAPEVPRGLAGSTPRMALSAPVGLAVRAKSTPPKRTLSMRRSVEPEVARAETAAQALRGKPVNPPQPVRLACRVHQMVIAVIVHARARASRARQACASP